jgi:hypothetical protein
MKRYNIVTAKVYEKDGEQKKAWKNVGQLFLWEARGDKPESFQIELNMFPNEKFYVFEERPREARNDDEI